jgi:alpha-glucosidase
MPVLECPFGFQDNSVTEPWMYGEPYTSAIRAAIALRYRMLPYWYSLMREAHREGTPIMRPLVYEFQNDIDSWDESDVFMFGRAILVATVLEEGARVVRLRLPAGADWYDWWSRKRHAGGTVVEVPVGLTSIPMFIRGGAVVAQYAKSISSVSEQADELQLILTKLEASSFTLYEDDGSSMEYSDGHYIETTFDVTVGAQVKIQATLATGVPAGELVRYSSPIQRVMFEVIWEVKGAYWVTLDGEELQQYLLHEQLEVADSGWMFDAAAVAVKVKFPNPRKCYELIISYEKFDLIGM